MSRTDKFTVESVFYPSESFPFALLYETLENDIKGIFYYVVNLPNVWKFNFLDVYTTSITIKMDSAYSL